MVVNKKGLDLIKNSEGCKLQAYQDSVGVWTIGYGHTGEDVVPGLALTKDQADNIFASDIYIFSEHVRSLITNPHITDNQFSAMVSLAYNIGLSNFKKSSVLKYTNLAEYDAAANSFLDWTKAGGKVLPGLITRRYNEKELYESV